MDTRRRALAVLLALASPLVLAGCNGDGTDTAGDAVGTTAVSAAPSTAASASTATASPAKSAGTVAFSAKGSAKPTPTATAGGGGGEVEHCVNPMLSVTASTADGAAGTMVQRFVLTNVSSAACSLTGRPTLAPYAPPGAPALSVAVGAIPAGFGGLGGSGGTLVLAPGGTAAFFLKWSNVPTGDAPCPKAAGFAFRAPLDPLADADKKVPFAFQPCGGAAQVSQVLPASVTS
ncbi:DUF4232 domain-containing protein [Streptomyces sp. NRRL B-24484]|uniref:DUF4232 domain-containing protein n=1 Tax=Streptomyces sp. NRRL B-24484 TaxID=1463833 RepID=UPI0004BE9B08|nr:DUF4232 domain-containing protein [Streptomyces sp. NRRL B-24484]